ncbi:F0F1-type ATP synthase, subunit b [Buchnera aphidicola (Nipponaphis monzeni)]|uniref:ATP synthase subunit b n=1 Tax=Buchnera aphidicola (Nipponaphis monzeni) TaxID=2495405 RepID=A0A455T9M8_9GAMM|nr:F0F1 ATP synthase subunit B [Buchnera aphidicola]BBI01022.1 F0F1-type ATP synthase, subunit b [Buchnera aphidicola (Nipponaphis monzeni)]
MNFNITILGQAISFIIFVVIAMKFIWPPIIQSIELKQLNLKKSLKMQKDIKSSFKNSEILIKETINNAKCTAFKIIEEANINKHKILAEVELEAIKKRDLIISQAYFDIEVQRQKIYKKLKNEISDLSVSIAKKIIIDTLKTNEDISMISNLISN